MPLIDFDCKNSTWAMQFVPLSLAFSLQQAKLFSSGAKPVTLLVE